MKNLISILLITIGLTSGVAQSEWGLGYQLKSGFLLAHRGNMVNLPQQTAWASEFSFFRHLHQANSWVDFYKDPKVGVSLFIGSVGNNAVLGRYIATYGFAELPMARINKFELSWKLGSGIGITNRKYDSIFNPENIAIGSNLNMMIVMALQAQYEFQKSSISLSADMTHFSNSAFKVPNLGLNIPYFSLGYRKKIGTVRRPISRGYQFDFKKFYWSVQGVFSLKETMPYGLRKYLIYGGSISTKSVLNPKVGFEFGLDVFSNQSHIEVEPLVEKSQINLIQMGIYGAYFVPMNHIHFIFGMGAYVRDWYKPNGLLYHRVGVRYQWRNGLFGHVAIKSHWAKADYLELGLGYIISRRSAH